MKYKLCFLVGGADKNAVIFHKESEQIVATLKGHTKKVTSVIYHPKEVHMSCIIYNNYWPYLLHGLETQIGPFHITHFAFPFHRT